MARWWSSWGELRAIWSKSRRRLLITRWESGEQSVVLLTSAFDTWRVYGVLKILRSAMCQMHWGERAGICALIARWAVVIFCHYCYFMPCQFHCIQIVCVFFPFIRGRPHFFWNFDVHRVCDAALVQSLFCWLSPVRRLTCCSVDGVVYPGKIDYAPVV